MKTGAVPATVLPGALAATVNVQMPLPAPARLLAVTFARYVPAWVNVPEMTPS